MKKYSASLKFKDYLVKEMSFKQNENFAFEEHDELEVDFDISALIQISDEYEAVTLQVVCGNQENKNTPFEAKVEILGLFSFEGDKKNAEEFLKSSGVAVLFPYARSLLSELTSKSNAYPAYNLPLINVPQFLNDNDSVKVIHVKDGEL